MLQKPELSAGLMGHLARKQTLPYLLTVTNGTLSGLCVNMKWYTVYGSKLCWTAFVYASCINIICCFIYARKMHVNIAWKWKSSFESVKLLVNRLIKLSFSQNTSEMGLVAWPEGPGCKVCLKQNGRQCWMNICDIFGRKERGVKYI